ncbi:DUF3088 domain-containing protein [Caulobacter sp. UNC358MFTsu5.1]|uniref:DUF3088 domain-containing protein n=1 Tax=Caulobacter sp. UNC358MFTsu5.1 TaxID=1449049 RepID=UPI0018CC04C7|nr:DUF3088 domain-containing protein [Caulobacter sp. UNC358MFTsu5.1]
MTVGPAMSVLSPPPLMGESMKRDTLFLVQPGFTDPAYPDQRFYCWHCALLEGVLASFPELAEHIDVQRVAWLRPRQDVIAMAGSQNQSLPLMVLAEGSATPHRTGEHNGRVIVADKDKILAVLSERHGFPNPHP